MEELKPVAGDTPDGVKALIHRGSEVEAGEESEYPRNMPDTVDDNTSSEEDPDSDEDSDSAVDLSALDISGADTEVRTRERLYYPLKP